MSKLHLRFPCVPFIVMNAAGSSFYKLQISYNGWLWCRGQRSDLEGELKFSHRNDIYRCAADTATVVLFLFQLPYYIDGSVTLTQSTTILRYLARKHGLGKYHKTYFSCTLHILVLPVMEGWWCRDLGERSHNRIQEERIHGQKLCAVSINVTVYLKISL